MIEREIRPPVDPLLLEEAWRSVRQELLQLLLEEARRQHRPEDVEMLQELLVSQEPVEWYHFQSYLEMETIEGRDVGELLEQYRQLDRQYADRLADLEIEEQQKAHKRRVRNTIITSVLVVCSVVAVLMLTPDRMAFEVRKKNVLEMEKFKTFAEVSYFQSVELVQAMNLKPPRLTPQYQTFQELQSAHSATLWGPATHVWMYRDEAGNIREVLWTGHAEPRTRHSWWSLLYNTALTQRAENASRLLLSGLARLSFRYNCGSSPMVERYLTLQRTWRTQWRASQALRVRSQATLDASLEKLNRQLSQLKQNKQVLAYTRCVAQQGRSFLTFARQAKRLLAKDGLSVGHDLPYHLMQQARQRMEKAYQSKKEYLVVFHDLLRKAGVKKALVSFAMRWHRDGKPVVFKLPKASFVHESLPRARKSYLKELEHVMLGDAREREVLYRRRLKDNERLLAKCEQWQKTDPARLLKKIWIEQLCSSDGRCHLATTPISLTQKVYCKRYVPLNILLARLRLQQTQELLQTIQNPDSQAKLKQYVAQAMWDALLRNGPLPVGQYQADLWQWQAQMRDKIWSHLYRSMLKQNIPVRALADRRVVFRVQVQDKHIEIQPIWVVELSQTSFRFSPKTAIPILEQRMPSRLGAYLSTCQFAPAASKTPEPAGPSTKPDARQPSPPSDTQEQDNPFLQDDALRHMCLRGSLADTFLQYWNQQQDSTQQLGQLPAMGRTYLDVMDTLQGFRAVSGDSSWSKGIFHTISRLYRLLRDYRGVPPELHAQLAYTIATHVAFFMQHISKIPIATWDVLASVAGSLSPHSPQIGQLRYDPRFRAYQRRFFLDVRRYPFAIIEQSIQAMRKADRAFYVDWLRRKGSPRRRSQMMLLLQRYYPPSSLVEQQQIDVLRVTKHLQTYQALQAAAAYLLTAQVPRLRGLFEQMSRAVLLTEADSLIIRRLQESVGVISEDTHITSSELRVLLATQLQRSARKMLQQSHVLLSPYMLNHIDSPALRLLKARFFFEDGQYHKALQTMCKTQTPLAYYHPSLRWKLLTKDWRGAVLNIHVQVKDGALLIWASAKGPAQPFLQLTGLSPTDLKELTLQLQSLGALEHQTRLASEQLLMLPVSLPSRVLRVFQRVQQADVAKALIRDMVYTCRAPGQNLVRRTKKCRFPFVRLP